MTATVNLGRWRFRFTEPRYLWSDASNVDPVDLQASCGSQTHVYNDTPLDGGTQQTGQETQRTDARAGALCILSENMSD